MEGVELEKIVGFSWSGYFAIPQDLKFKDEDSVVQIGKNSTIREC